MPQDPVIFDQTDNTGHAARAVEGPVMLVNLFTPKPGQEQAFIDAQTAEYRRLEVEGWMGNRLGRSVDGGKLVNVAVFSSLAAYKLWRASDAFAAHVEVIRPHVEQAAPGMYEILYSAGQIP
ncbi:MAG: antibiotic biosynthesis monooxygenase family protein [Roseovarius sp.]